jgi:hypothetical protein
MKQCGPPARRGADDVFAVRHPLGLRACMDDGCRVCNPLLGRARCVWMFVLVGVFELNEVDVVDGMQ